MTPYEAAAVLAVFAAADARESLLWNVDTATDARDVKLAVRTSGFFSWATHESEGIAAADVDLLTLCLADLRQTGDEWCFTRLFAARKRRLRPLPDTDRKMKPETRALFDACSTEAHRAEVERQDLLWTRHAALRRRQGGDARDGRDVLPAG